MEEPRDLPLLRNVRHSLPGMPPTSFITKVEAPRVIAPAVAPVAAPVIAPVDATGAALATLLVAAFPFLHPAPRAGTAETDAKVAKEATKM